MTSKKGQEEMIGFVLIVIIVTVAILIMMIFSLRKSSGVESSLNVETFLQASSYFTTDCEIAGQSLSLKKLIVSCQNNERCNDEKEACEALNQSFKGLIEANWLESYKGYELKVYSLGDANSTTSILQMKKGNLTGSFEGGDVLFPVPPNRFHIYLKVYF